MSSNGPGIALALGGGAARGWAHIGALRALGEEGIRIDAVAGASIGALAALCFAAGRLDILEEIALGATHRRVLAYLDPHLGRGAWFGGRRIARELEEHIGAIRLEDLSIPIALIAADLKTGEEVRLTSGPAITAVQASIGLPGIFRPTLRDGRLLIDGGIVSNLPIGAARALASGQPVVAIDLMGDYVGYIRASTVDGRSALGTVRSAFLMMTAQQTRQAVALDPPDVLITIPAGHIGTGAFTRAAELIRLGHDAVIAALPAIRDAQSADRHCELVDATHGILDFWFREIGPDRWWTQSDATDAEIRARFLSLWDKWRTRSPECFLGTAREALGAVVLFDQFSRNMFRGHARAFSADALALEIAKRTIERGLDQSLTREERSFLYMPFMHSEDLAMQDRSIALFEQLGQPEQLKYAHLHRDVIARFGRFPARNAALARKSRTEEREAIEASKNW
jgi:NTE family protein